MATNYNPRAVTDGLVLHVDAANPKSLSESAGTISIGSTWTDLSGTGNHGTITGSNTVFFTDNTGYINFDDTYGNNANSSHVDFDNTSSLNMTDALSIESWVNFNTNSSDFIFEKGSVNTQYSQFSHGTDIVFRTKHTGDISFHTLSAQKTSASIVNGQWHHIVGSWDGSTKRLYVDSVLITTASKTNTLVTTTNGARIGAFGQGSFGYPFGGKIAKVAVYNIGLTEAQVKQNFNATRGRFGV
jgi:hypothetical protein